MNWVWYEKLPESSVDFAEAMTDKDGRIHRNFLPMGLMSGGVWAKQRRKGNEILASPFAELINKTEQPFLSAIHDYAAPQAAFYDDKLLLVGEALALFRPHLALSFNQAALHCILLKKVIKGEINMRSWERQVVKYGRQTQLMNAAMGNFYVFGGMTFALSLIQYIFCRIQFWR
jgi:hypothetical protein